MVPARALADAARELRPYRQGDLDALCGLYAVVNAIQLVTYPRVLRSSERARLFARGLDALERGGRLRFALSGGMSNRLWHSISRAVIAEARRCTGLPLVLVKPRPNTVRTTDDAIGLIRHHLRRGRPVLLELSGRLNHWTVVVRLSQARLTFFDSSGHHWVPIRSVELVRGRHRPAHGVFATGIVALRLLRTPPAKPIPVDTCAEGP